MQPQQEERKQKDSVGILSRSAISSEGRRSRYAHAGEGGHYLGCPFYRFELKTSSTNFMHMRFRSRMAALAVTGKFRQ